MPEMTLDDLKQHWEKAGRQFPHEGRVTPTSRDPFLGELEEDNILRHLSPDDHALEIGCGDGSHTVAYARRVKHLSAIDVAESLVELASKKIAGAGLSNTRILAGSALALTDMFGTSEFDVVISQRCLINLPSWEGQQHAILQAHQMLRSGGLFLLTEGFQGEFDTLNKVRRTLGLDDIVTVAYNKNLDRETFESWTRQYFDLVETRHYGAYLFISRVLHPLAVKPDPPKHDAKINEAAMLIARNVTMPDLRRFSYNLFYALRKR